MRLLVALSCLLLTAGIASAQNWVESPDAGDLCSTGQVPTGAGPLLTISGTIGSTSDADLFLVEIPDALAFSATTCFTTTIDTQLFMFNDGDCIGITHDDDDPGGCGLQSTITGRACPFPPGCYWVGISTYNTDPNGPNGLIWANTPYNVERCPDGPGAPGPLTLWTGTGSTGAYTITLQGANYCAATAVEPATWGQIKSIY